MAWKIESCTINSNNEIPANSITYWINYLNKKEVLKTSTKDQMESTKK